MTTPSPGFKATRSNSVTPLMTSGNMATSAGSRAHANRSRAKPDSASPSSGIWCAYPVSPSAIAAATAAWTGGASAKSISATNAGRTSGGKACHLELRRRLSSLNESWSNALFVIWMDGYPSPMESNGLPVDESSRLYELDRTHWLHPQGDLGAPAGTIPQVVFASGQGATLTDVEGRKYIDGMASLWNVNVGYGRAELAEAAAAQMKTL